MQTIENMEIALIELQYAAADLVHYKDSDLLASQEVQALVLKISAAAQAVQIALDVLGPNFPTFREPPDPDSASSANSR
jgi:hypothetical protein